MISSAWRTMVLRLLSSTSRSMFRAREWNWSLFQLE